MIMTPFKSLQKYEFFQPHTLRWIIVLFTANRISMFVYSIIIV